jgi:hypothetical protein
LLALVSFKFAQQCDFLEAMGPRSAKVCGEELQSNAITFSLVEPPLLVLLKYTGFARYAVYAEGNGAAALFPSIFMSYLIARLLDARSHLRRFVQWLRF